MTLMCIHYQLYLVQRAPCGALLQSKLTLSGKGYAASCPGDVGPGPGPGVSAVV
jgi:hypothetical protein